MSEIWGSVTQEDIHQTHYLLDWYQRRGFTISNPDEECVHTAAKKIVLKLKSGGAIYLRTACSRENEEPEPE